MRFQRYRKYSQRHRPSVLTRIAALLFVLVVIIAPSPGIAEADTRIALVIGNSSYEDSPLKNPVNDVRSMAAALQTLGFKVIARENATKQQMERAVAEFGRALTPGAVALFYYAGHAIQVSGHNYLVPVDAQITAERTVRLETVDVDLILDQITGTGSGVNVVILDACRNNPFERRFRGQDGGLAQISAPKGTLIAYATAPGKVAFDGVGANGVYTSKLVQAIKTPGLPIEEVFKKVRVEVARETRDDQTPWEASSLVGTFYFTAPTTIVINAPLDRDALYWQSVKDTKDPAQVQMYLDEYPNGAFAPLAKAVLAGLQRPAQSASVAVAAAPPKSQFDGSWEGEHWIWRVKARIVGGRIEGTIRCSYGGYWSTLSPAFAGTIKPDGTIDADTTQTPEGWSPRRIEGRMPKIRVTSNHRKLLDCGDGEAVVTKID